MKRLSISFVLLLVAIRISAGQAESIELHQALLDLSGEGVLMDVSAHPDDEDGATLAYYRMKYGVTTYSVFLTRGEGGMNEIGPELYGDLGVLRTRETEAAGVIQDTRVFFLNLVDFGFCKNPIEAFHRWGGKREVVGRLVYAIRKFKPDVIITNHNTITGHGHHQAAAIALLEAFDAAADSSSFPEQLRSPGITVWQPRKLFFRAPSNRQSRSSDVGVPIGEMNSTRKNTYADIAIEALHQHRTQGMDRMDVRPWVRSAKVYTLMRESSSYDDDSTSLFSGIDLWATREQSPIASLRGYVSRLSALPAGDSLLRGVSTSLDSVRILRGTPSDAFGVRMLDHWQETLEQVAELVGGVHPTIVCSDSVLVPGQETTIDASLTGPSTGPVQFRLTVPAGWTLRPDATSPRLFYLSPGMHPRFTMPVPEYLYTPIDLDHSVLVHGRYSLNGIPLSCTRRVEVNVAPPQTLTTEPAVAWLPPGEESVKFTVAVKNFEPGSARGMVAPILPEGWTAEAAPFSMERENQQVDVTMTIAAPDHVADGSYTLGFETGVSRAASSINVFDVATNVRADIGIVESYDNTLETVAHELGVHYVILPDKYLENLDLLQYGTIIVDIRAYLVRPALVANNKRLLEYVRRGGNLIVMYQKDQEWKPEYAPFPFVLGRKRVTLEDAPVKVLLPEHPLLTHPNLLTKNDWTGWVQERGVYFPENVPSEYERLISSHDPDEEPLTTGYLVASYGKGSYIYTSYVWYRQLKEKNPGAYRAFANMISYPSYRKE